MTKPFINPGTITVRARDTATAMDEVVRRLGPDAYILSTRQAAGLVEIRASADVPLRNATVRRFAEALRNARAPQAGDTALPAPARTPADATIPPLAAGPPPIPAGPEVAPPAPTRALPDVAALARRVLLPGPVALDSADRFIVIGPPGAGKSLLAARIAALIFARDRRRRPRLLAPSPGPRLTEDRLRGWARMMGLGVEHPTLAQTRCLAPPDPGRPEILDLSEVPDAACDLAAHLGADPAAEVIVALPTGLHSAHLTRLLRGYAGLHPSVCLTRLDLWEPEPDELTTLADCGLRISRIAQGTGLLDALRQPDFSDLSRWAAGWARPMQETPAGTPPQQTERTEP